MQEPVKDLDELQNSDWVRRIFTDYTARFSSVTSVFACLLVITTFGELHLFVPTRPGSGCR